MTVRAILFDLDGTLLRYRRDYRDILADAVRDVIGRVPEGILDRYDEAFYANFRAIDPEPVKEAFATIQDDAEPATLADALLEHEIEACEPPPGAESDLNRLGRGFRLGVVTNGVRAWQLAKLRAYRLEGYFDTIVASYEAGAHKPAVAPFKLAERRLPADAYAMVGDDEADVRGALKAGWTTYRYAGEGFGNLRDALDWT